MNAMTINGVRLPILRADGTLELLPEGYAAASGILTLVRDFPMSADAALRSVALEAAKGLKKFLIGDAEVAGDALKEGNEDGVSGIIRLGAAAVDGLGEREDDGSGDAGEEVVPTGGIHEPQDVVHDEGSLGGAGAAMPEGHADEFREVDDVAHGAGSEASPRTAGNN